MRKQIANVAIHAEGDGGSMKLFMNADTDEDMVVAAAGISRALLNVCEKMDPEAPELLAIKFLDVSFKVEEESRQIIEEGEETLPC